jgi:hypothetical protein
MVSLAIVVLLLEATVRFTVGAPRAERIPLLRVKPDPQLGYRPLPGDAHYSYDQLTELNSLGFRGPDVTPKGPDEFRILALGETQAYGLGLTDDELFTHILEEELNGMAPDRRCRVINLGVRGFTLNQQLALLQTLGVSLKPDYVILFFYIYSFGQFNISKYYEQVKHRDWYMLDFGTKPTGTALWRWRLIQVGRRSALIAFLHYQYKRWVERDSLANKLLRGDTNIKVNQTFNYVDQQLGLFQNLAHRNGFLFSLAVIPLPQQLLREYPGNEYQAGLRRIATAHEISFLDLLPPLSDLYRQLQRVPVAPFDAHYDATAHRAMATRAADFLRRETGSSCYKVGGR